MMKTMLTAVLMAAGSCASLLMALSPSTAHAATVHAVGATQATSMASVTPTSARTITIQTRAVSAIPQIPDAASNCTYGSSGGNIYTCFQIKGSGLYVDYMAMQSCVISSTRTIHQEYSGPSFNPPVNTPNKTVQPGQCLDSQVNIYGNVASGTYCGTTWRYNGGSSYTDVGRICFDVHSQ